jgi:hypothetical protein
MKAKLVIVLMTVLLATTGSTCLNEGFLIALNLPIEECYPINAGPNLNFAGSATVPLTEELDEVYRDNIKSARYYDMLIGVRGSYNGSVAGTATINGIPLLTFSGSWDSFSTPQSILGGSTLITPQTAGVNELVRVLDLLPSAPGTTVALAVSGTLSGQSPVPSGLSVCVEIKAQADSEGN